jgi:hypothetical protein
MIFSKKKKILSAMLSLAMIGTMVASVPFTASADATTTTTAAPGVSYTAHVQSYGDLAAVTSGLQGTENKSKRVEALSIKLTGAPATAKITYQVQGQSYGWQAAKSNGEQAGSVGKSKRVEALKITLSGMPGYQVSYRAHIQSLGTSAWVTTANDTAIADAKYVGTEKRALRIEAYEVIVSKTTAEVVAEANAETAVAKAEASKAQGDIDAASALVDKVQIDAVKTAFASRLTAINVTLAVASITAVNGNQISVVFSKAVNETSAETTTNYTIASTGVARSIASAELQSDKKTVILSLNTATPLVNAVAYKVTVSGVLDATLAVVPDYSTSFIANDATAPTLVSVVSTAKATTSSITLTFSEPVDKTAASAIVDGSYVSSMTTSGNTLVLTTSTTLTAGKSYAISLMNVKDYAGNATATNPLATSVTVASDTVAPNVVSVAVKSDKTLEITFDKAMNIATLTANSYVKLYDSNLGSTAGTLGTATSVDTTVNKVWDYTISGTTWNSTNVENAIVALTNTVADTSGNAITAVMKNVSFTKDTTAPTIVSAVYKNTSTYGTTALGAQEATPYGSIVLTYNEDVVSATGTVPTTVINNAGSSVTAFTAGSAIVNGSNSKELILPLASTGAVASTVSSYLIVLPASLVTDDSQTLNASVSMNQTVSVSAGAVTSGDTTAPVITAVTATAASSITSGSTIAYTITETNPDFTTIVNTNNYTLGGAGLPTGSYITVAGSAGSYTATVHIPAGSITADKLVAASGYVFVISGIKDLSGNTATVNVSTLALAADTKPVLNSAVINTNGTLTIGFSLGVSAASTVASTDLVLTVNGTALSLAATAPTGGAAGTLTKYMIADGTGNDAGKYVITVYDAAGTAYSLTNATTLVIATGSTVTGIKTTGTIAATATTGTSITVR